jgi:hypothetical protein
VRLGELLLKLQEPISEIDSRVTIISIVFLDVV